MTTYKPYNIVIHGNPQYRRAEFPFEEAVGPVAKAYEERVWVIMNAIARTSAGRALLASLSLKIPVYIVPYTGVGCNARTGQLTSDWMKGIWVQYSPETWAFDRCGSLPGYRPVETLFHEMVHASRKTNVDFDREKLHPLEKMDNHEEFLAVMLTNVFRSDQAAMKFNRDYLTGTLLGQTELEVFLSSNMSYIEALAYYLNDRLVKLVSPLSMPFNPFRDFKRLQAKYFAHYQHTDRLRKSFVPELLRR